MRARRKLTRFRDPASPIGRPPAPPGRRPNFENSGSIPPLLYLTCASPLRSESRAVALAFAFHRLRTGPFEGPATVKLPALPEDTHRFHPMLAHVIHDIPGGIGLTVEQAGERRPRNAFAAAVSVSPAASTISLRIKAPGWGGLLTRIPASPLLDTLS